MYSDLEWRARCLSIDYLMEVQSNMDNLNGVPHASEAVPSAVSTMCAWSDPSNLSNTFMVSDMSIMYRYLSD